MISEMAGRGDRPGFAEREAIHRSVAFHIIPFLCLGFLAAYIDRVNVGFAKFEMLDDLHMGDAAFGLGAGIFFLAYILCEVPSNIILERVGARLWLARILLTWGIISALTCCIHGTTMFYLARFALGVAEAGFMPGALFYLGQWVPAERRARATALFMIGIPLSSVIGAPLSGAILAHLSGWLGIAGWRWLFLIEGAPPILLGAWAFFYLPASIQEARWLTSEQRDYLLADMAREDDSKDKRSDFLSAFTDIRVWIVGIIDGSILLGLYTIAFWFPSFLREHGVVSIQGIALLAMLPHIAAVVSMVVVGRRSDRRGERHLHIVVPIAIGSVALGLSGSDFFGLPGLVVLVVLANAALLAALPALWALPVSFLSGSAAAAGLAVACSFANIAGFFATSVVGFSVQHTHSVTVVLWGFAVMMTLSSTLVFVIKRFGPSRG